MTIGGVYTTPLSHLLFDTDNGWEKAKMSDHPTLSLTASIDKQDYLKLDRETPSVHPFTVSAVTDTGAQSCLWGLDSFLQAGFTKGDLIPVRHSLYAANKEEIPVFGAIFLRLSGQSSTGQSHAAAVMVYVSPSSSKFYLFKDALVQLGVISSSFPQLGSALHQASIHNKPSPCGCPKRTGPPARPEELPFDCTPNNNSKMRDWLTDYFAASTFNHIKSCLG